MTNLAGFPRIDGPTLLYDQRNWGSVSQLPGDDTLDKVHRRGGA
jgi:hypothetical protein